MRLWVVVYDITDDRRRRHLALRLGKQLERVQESVFEGWLSGIEARQLLGEIATLVDITADRLRAYPLALRTQTRYRKFGCQRPIKPYSDYWIIG